MSDEQTYAWDRLPFVLSIAEVATVLRTSVTSVRRGLRSGAFPVQPMPRTSRTAAYRWSRSSITRYVEAGGWLVPKTAGRRNYFTKGRAVRATLAQQQRVDRSV